MPLSPKVQQMLTTENSNRVLLQSNSLKKSIKKPCLLNSAEGMCAQDISPVNIQVGCGEHTRKGNNGDHMPSLFRWKYRCSVKTPIGQKHDMWQMVTPPVFHYKGLHKDPGILKPARGSSIQKTTETTGSGYGKTWEGILYFQSVFQYEVFLL